MALKNYETVLIFSVSKGDEAVESLKAKFTKMIEKNGQLGEVEDWGKRKLAYPINDETEGYYILCNYQADADFPAEFDRVLGITDGVLRSLIIAKGE